MEILNDFDTSLKKSFDEIDPNWESYKGLVICGTHSPNNVDEIIEKIQKVRENQFVPFLGICAGLQLAVIEFARTVWGIKDATSEEFGNGTFIVKKLPKLRVGMKDVLYTNMEFFETGNQAGFGQSFNVKRGDAIRKESHWHNYAILEPYIEKLMQSGFFVSASEGILEILFTKMTDHKWFMAVQFHPEYQSSKEKPHPILKEFLTACKNYGK